MLIDQDYSGPGPLTPAGKPSLRTELRDIIQRSIDLLDAIDGHLDEWEPDGDDEASLGWTPIEAVRGAYGPPDVIHGVDLEHEHDGREETSLERYGAGFVASGPDDAEDTNDAEHDTADYEPSLGSVDCMPMPVTFLDGAERRIVSHSGSQVGWALGGRDDYEEDPAEMGIGDSGGLCEQTYGEDGRI